MAITAASIEANGWVLRLTVSAGLGTFGSYALDPGGTPRVTLTSNHAGFVKSGGQAIAGIIGRSLIATKPLRLPVNPGSPNTPVIDETDLGGGLIRVRLALTEHVYATDTALSLAVLAGWRTGEGAASGIAVSNASTAAAPVPIMRWALLPYAATAGAFTLALLVVSHHPVGLEPVAGVRFTATDGSNVKTVWTTQLSTDTSYGDNLRCYTAVINPATATALTTGLLRCDAEVYPWLGAMRTTDAAGTRSMANLRSDGFAVDAASPWVIGHDPAGTRYGGQVALVDPVNGTVTAASGMVQATLAAARAMAPAALPRDINTAIQAGYLANRTLPAANGQPLATRNVDGMQIYLAAGIHAGPGSGGVTSGLTVVEVPIRIIGDPAAASPRDSCILQTAVAGVNRGARLMWQNLTIELATTALAGSSSTYNMVDNCIVRSKAGQEASGTAPFTAAAPAGFWNFGIVRSRWWRTSAAIGNANARPGLVRATETQRTVNSSLIAVKNRLISSSEDGFIGSATFTAFGAWPAATLVGQSEDFIIAYNDIRNLRARAVVFAAVSGAIAGTPNNSIRRNAFIGNVVERIGTDPSPFYGLGEDASATMSYIIIEGNSFVGDRSNTFYSDPLPVTLADTNAMLNQAFVNRVANNAFDWLPTKHDDFNDNSSATLRGTSNGYRPQMIEAWSMLYGVGHEANVDTRRTGSSLFPLEYSGPGTLTDYAGAIAPLYTDDRSLLGTGTGTGNYRPLAVSPLAGRGLRANADVDGDGILRRVPFAAGAFQAAAIDLFPAATRSAQQAGVGVVKLGLTLAPAAGRSPQRAALGQVQLGLALAPVPAHSAQRAATSGVQLGLAVVPAAGRSAQRTTAPLTGWTATLAAVGVRHALVSAASAVEPLLAAASNQLASYGTTTTLVWSARLDPARARSGSIAGGTMLGLAITLAPAAVALPLVSTAPVMAPDTLLTIIPDHARIGVRSSPAPLLGEIGAGLPNAVLTIGADPRTLFPNRN